MISAPANDIDGLKKLLAVLRARKVFSQTKVLSVTNRGLPGECGLGVWDSQGLEKRLGVVVKSVSYQALTDEMERVMADRQATESAEQAAEALFARPTSRTSTGSTWSVAASSIRR